MENQIPKPKSNRGGRRVGAGRKRKGQQPATALASIDLRAALEQPAPDEIESVAKRDAHESVAALVKQITHGISETAKIAACNEVLDRGYGKPAVEIGGDAMLPFMPAPSGTAALTTAAEIRADARRFANLAIAVLRKIRDTGESETARVSAIRSLLNRGLGTAAPARMPDEFSARPLGKKEEQQQAAAAAGTGRYATPEPPRVLQ